MRCPRCDGHLVKFVIETTDHAAVVCESCGFAGVPASHQSDELAVESWDDALERIDRQILSPERTCTTTRADSPVIPTDETDATIEAERLEESVSVAASLRSKDSKQTKEQ